MQDAFLLELYVNKNLAFFHHLKLSMFQYHSSILLNQILNKLWYLFFSTRVSLPGFWRAHNFWSRVPGRFSISDRSSGIIIKVSTLTSTGTNSTFPPLSIKAVWPNVAIPTTRNKTTNKIHFFIIFFSYFLFCY